MDDDLAHAEGIMDRKNADQEEQCDGSGYVGFWMGAEHRGRGHMSEALRLVADWTLTTGYAGIREIGWECLVGNTASASVARRCGFRFTGEAPSRVAYRDGTHPPSWTGALADTDVREPQAGWPACDEGIRGPLER